MDVCLMCDLKSLSETLNSLTEVCWHIEFLVKYRKSQGYGNCRTQTAKNESNLELVYRMQCQPCRKFYIESDISCYLSYQKQRKISFELTSFSSINLDV